MELLYLWIEDYKNIQKQGFNFSSQYRFDYNSETNELIQLPDNPNRIPNFFPEGISNVTAIIGENGSGKSSVLNLILTFIANSKLGSKFFLVGKSDKGIYLDGSENFENKIKILKNNQAIVYNKMYEYEMYEGENARVKKYHTQIIYHSPLFQAHRAKLNHKETKSNDDKAFIDISLNQAFNKVIQIINSQGEHDIGDAVIDTIFKINKQDIFAYFGSENSEYPPFEIPKKVRLNTYYNYELISNQRTLRIEPKNEDEQKTKALIEDKINNHIAKANEYYLAKDSILIDIFRYHLDTKKLPFPDNQAINQPIIEFILDYYKNNDKELSNKITEFFSFFENLWNQKTIYELNLIKLTKETFSDFRSLYQQLKSIVVDIRFWAKFAWDNEHLLSSGEEYRLDLYAKIRLAQQKSKNDDEYFDSVLFLFDESETTFHPQWQKQYLKNLIDFLPNIFPSKQLQIILTSNSPFIASDLPNSNIIFLEKGEGGRCVVKDSLNEMKQTFGANIHTLLTDSFFMKDGLMGDFAKGKINQLIAYLNQEKSEIQDDDTAQKYIRLIGEPIIRNQLQKILDSKRLEKVKEIDGIKLEINKLEARLKKLEGDDTN